MANQQEVHSHTLSNGLVLVAQSMPWLASSAFSINIPAGCRYDPADKIALSNFTCEMVQRGCGELDSRQYIEQLELNGIDYNSSSSVYHMHFGGAMRAENLLAGLSIYADVLLRPWMPEEQLEDGRLVCVQEVRALEDDLVQRVMIDLRERFYGQPDGRDCHGTLESVQSISLKDIKEFHKTNFRPNGTIISIAGKFDWESLKDHIEELFGEWEQQDVPSTVVAEPQHGIHHIPFESQQTQIALAYRSIPVSDPDYFQARGAVGVLSDGMSSRLFHEVREKRGLCYSVFASNHSIKEKGCVVCYSGTTADRAQETLNVLVEQLENLKLGIHEDELRRLKVQIRSGLVMQQESCRSRAASIAGDWFHFGRVRLLDELNECVNQLTVESINQYLKDNPPQNFDLVTLGPKPLDLPDHAVSSTSA